MTQRRINQIEGGRCPHFNDGRACRGCEYSANPAQFDAGCLYGHEDLLREIREEKREQKPSLFREWRR